MPPIQAPPTPPTGPGRTSRPRRGLPVPARPATSPRSGNSPGKAALTGHSVESPFHNYRLQEVLGESLSAGGYGYGAAEESVAAGACHSFVSHTQVLVKGGGAKQIQDIRADDAVIATDPRTGKTTTREVLDTITTKDDKDFVALTIDEHADGVAGHSVVATTTHPFWSPSQGAWVDAGDLRPGMTLRTEAGHQVKIAAVRHFTKRQITHDLTVSGVHTYYVLAGQTPVLVHNSNGCVLPTPSVSDSRLQNLVNDLYKGTTNPARTGDGTTMSAIRDELSSGQLVHGRNHVAKGNQYAKALNKWISRNHRGGDPHDLIVARSLLADLKSALAGD
ncbi:polymorphic toxin-type HINT domain-containing protein [Streptomyces sp. NPDC127190]|uniref:polymorphic toxin-type HINT domain-containing protein n=1 Tax=unclassified Streptomyces TaxID=2593676 RepID=UPI00363976E4